MPELPEVEAYRQLAEKALGRRIAAVRAPDAWYLKRGLTAAMLAAAVTGRCFEAADRIGKLLLLSCSGGGPVVGLRFGMTGRLVVDGTAGVEGLLYSSNAPVAKYDRLVVEFGDGGDLRMRDPRRLGGVELEPDTPGLGPDARAVTVGTLRGVLDGSRTALKARLMDQSRLAGVGNLIADEVLWRAGLSPSRPAGSLTQAELRRLGHHLRRTIEGMIAGGGSHTGRLLPHRRPGGLCPRDGAALVRATVGGRTTWWCPAHQR